jgi:hypothetical protein
MKLSNAFSVGSALENKLNAWLEIVSRETRKLDLQPRAQNVSRET